MIVEFGSVEVRVWAKLRAAGIPENNDGLILASALARGVDAVITNNSRHFEAPGVDVLTVEELIQLSDV